MNNIGRQVVLMGTAVALGAFILWIGFDPQPSPATTPTPDVPTETEPTPAPSQPQDTSVLVANSTEVAGLAGTVSAQLTTGFGYTALPPVDAIGDPAATTLVFYVPGSEAEAQAIAASLSLTAGSVAPMPAAAPVADLAGADVLVLLGLDQVPAS